jgi:hypothetical protein
VIIVINRQPKESRTALTESQAQRAVRLEGVRRHNILISAMSGVSRGMSRGRRSRVLGQVPEAM